MPRRPAMLLACALLVTAAAPPLRAGDDNVPRYAWGGLYVGTHLGGALALTTADDPFGGSGCVQIANPSSDCSRPVPTTTEAIIEDDIWQAMRLGIAADLRLVSSLTLSADVAYLPYVHFSGTDDHVLRDLLSLEWASGTGTQLELILRYALTDQLSLGVGGRYWAMWTRDGTVNFGDEALVPMRFSVEQVALLVQGSYAFSDAENRRAPSQGRAFGDRRWTSFRVATFSSRQPPAD